MQQPGQIRLLPTRINTDGSRPARCIFHREVSRPTRCIFRRPAFCFFPVGPDGRLSLFVDEGGRLLRLRADLHLLVQRQYIRQPGESLLLIQILMEDLCLRVTLHLKTDLLPQENRADAVFSDLLRSAGIADRYFEEMFVQTLLQFLFQYIHGCFIAPCLQGAPVRPPS